jgi:hypothetical protein
MADKKISALTAATTPLAGTEVLPIVQGGSTVKVSIENVTAGRAVAATDIVASGEITSTTNNARLSLYRSAGTNYFDWASGQTLAFGTQTSQGGAGRVSKVNFLDSGDLTNVTGNFVVGTAGKGIDFSANGGDVLSQYDEGTYTPVITASSSDPTVTYTRQRGKYVRVGNVVTISVDLIWSAISGGSGDVRLSLPFAGESSVGASGAGPIAVLDGVTFAALRTFCSVQPQASVLYANLPQAGSAVSTTNTTVAQLSASGRFVLSCTYLV